MSYSEGSSRYLAIIEEDIAGTTPSTPIFDRIRNTGGNGIQNERSSIQSSELRPDRGISDMRLGQNKPSLDIPIEFGFTDFEKLVKGAIGNPFKGGIKLSNISVDFISTGSYLETADSSSWIKKGINVGDYIVISDAADVSNNDVFYVSAIGNGSGTNDRITLQTADKGAATIADETADSINIYSGYIGDILDSSTNNITVSASSKTITMASSYWISTLRAKVGDYVYFKGFTETNNNGWHKITALTSTEATFGNDTLTNETLSIGNLTIGSFIGVCSSIGNIDLPTFSVEEGFDDIEQYHVAKGCKVDQFSLSFQPDAMVTGTFTMQGQVYSGFTGSSVASSITEPTALSPFDSYTGELSINSSITEDTAVITQFEIQLLNNLNRRYALMQKDASSIGEGRINITGSLNAFFTDDSLATLYSNESEFAIEMSPRDLEGNIYVIRLPRVKFTSDSRTIAENDVTESLNYQALIDSNGETISIRKQSSSI